MIRVLVVEDSPVVRELLVYILNTDPDIRVVDTAGNGRQALDMVAQQKVDIVTMDVNMPYMDGFEATRRIMETHPVPIIIVSGNWDPHEVDTTFRALEAGALSVLPRPLGPGHADYEKTARQLIQSVKAMAEVKVVRRWARDRTPAARPRKPAIAAPPSSDLRLVAIGASTGGPVVFQKILSGLPSDFPAPILIVQHIAAGFMPGFVAWLGHTSILPAHLAVHDEKLKPGHVYVAPDGRHMGVRFKDRIALSEDPPENGLRPAISYLFRSVAEVFGAQAVGVLLTGMGRDGAAELKRMRDAGAVTIAQDKASSVIYGMPGVAVELGAAVHVLPGDRIAEALIRLVCKA